ncbi:MAG: SulP family inorganic anion transporter [Chloroflexi bacterium]|nr:SulP family inorganic anion transporter [Chloroflexota bacterium]
MSYLSSLKPDMKTLPKDIIVGFSTGLFSIPEGMAYASLAGVHPVYGLYSGMVSTLVAALSTGTILMISTLTSAIALSTASALSMAGVDANANPNALFTITFLVGVTMFVAGLLRLGKLVSFVSNAVMTGFVLGASMLIIIGELGDFFGYDPTGANDFVEIINWFVNIGQWDLTTTMVGVSTIVMVVALKRFKKTEKMASIIALLVMSVVVFVLKLPVALVESIGTIPRSLPTPMLPGFSLIPQLALGSVSVAIVALVQGAGISTAYPNPDKSKSSQNRDFIGEGLGNLAGSFFQSMGTGGSLSRTSISGSGGAKSRWGGIFAALWLALIVLLFGPLAELVPLAVIAGLLFVIGYELISARLPSAILIHRVSLSSAAAMWVTFLSALFIPLQWTIFLGAGLSLLLYVWASSQNVKVHHLLKNEQGRFEEQDMPDVYPSNQATVVSMGGTDFFAEVPIVEEELPSKEGVQNAVVIFRVRGHESASSTGMKFVQRYTQELKQSGNLLMLTGVQPHVMDVLKRTEIMDLIGEENIFPVQAGYGASTDTALEAAQVWIDKQPDSQLAASDESTSDDQDQA